MKRNFQSILSGIFVIGLLMAIGAHAASVKTWTFTSGSTLDAELAKVESRTAALKMQDGTMVQIPFTNLSRNDLDYLAELGYPVDGAPVLDTPAADAPAAEPTPNTQRASRGLQDLFGNELVNAAQAGVSVDELAGKKIGIYFSAHWCPPCRKFTPVLVKAYNEMVGKGLAFGLVFVSSDHDQNAMINYMKETDMPWLAIPFKSEKRQALGQKYGVRGIPTLVLVDENGKLITKDARSDVMSKGAKAYDNW